MVTDPVALDASLADRAWPAVGRPLLLVPVGSTEQHGPHLPLDVDTVVAVEVARRAAEALRVDGIDAVDAVVAPAVAFGASGEHQGFPGTLSIGTDALGALLVELGRSAAEWAERVVFVNGHGGNLDALVAAVPRLRDEGRPVAWVPCRPAPSRLSADEASALDAHAGHLETSLMLHLDSARVDVEAAAAAGAGGNTGALRDLLPALRRDGMRVVSPNGVLGDPTAATAEAGARLLDAMVADAVDRLRTGVIDERGCLVVRVPA